MVRKLSLQLDGKRGDQDQSDRFFHHSLYKQIQFIEEAILIVSGVSHLLMLRIIPPENLLLNRWTSTVVLLLLYFVLTRLDMIDRTMRAKIFLLSLSAVVVSFAYVSGQTTMVNPIFAMLVARTTLVLDGKVKWWMSGVVFLCLCASSYLKFWFWQWEALPVEPGAALVFLLPTFFYNTLWQGVLMALVALLVHSLVVGKQQIIETERMSRELADMAADLERARIGRDIHDGVGHSLTSLSVQLEVARKLLHRDPEKSENALVEAEKMAKRSLRDVRNSIALMRLEEFDFLDAVNTLLDGIESSGNFKVTSSIDLPPVPALTSYQIFRIIQESCTNALRHSGANEIEVTISHSEGNMLNIRVRDNGKGFDSELKISGFGLTGIKERVDDLKGIVNIASSNGGGTTVAVEIPLVPS